MTFLLLLQLDYILDEWNHVCNLAFDRLKPGLFFQSEVHKKVFECTDFLQS